MNTSTILKAIGIIGLCVSIHYGLGSLAWLVVFGMSLGFMFLP